MDDIRKVKVVRLVVMVVDHDECGEDGVRSALENGRFANRSISPHVMESDAVEVEWSDAHPLNQFATMAAEFRRLFGDDSYESHGEDR